MPISPTNLSKNIISPQNTSKTNVDLWADDIITWADVSGYWGDSYLVTNNSKNLITPTNLSKN